MSPTRQARRTVQVAVLVICGVAAAALSGSGAASTHSLRAVLHRGAPGSRKLDQRLAALGVASRPLARATGEGLAVEGSRVRVIVEGGDAAAKAAVGAAGGTVEASIPGLTQALVQPAALAALAASPGVQRVRPPALERAAAADEGVASMNADAWHAAGLQGAGVKVAVVDIGFQGWSLDSNLTGATPVTSFCSSDEFDGPSALPHGTAVADIVHQMAPGAQIYLVCVDSEVTLAQAESYIVSQGIKIVNHSVGWYGTSRGDGSGDPGSPDATVADARAHDVLWINAAGNDAQNHWGGTYTDQGGDGLLRFSGGDSFNRVTIDPGEDACAVLRWDAWPVTSEDLDLYLVDPGTGDVLAHSVGDQSGGPLPPVEELCYENAGGSQVQAALAVVRYSGSTTPHVDLSWLADSPLQYSTAEGSVVEPASSPDALAIGAVCWSSGVGEPYGSRGPTIDGRTKPELNGPDSTSSPVYGDSTGCQTGFAGTSASAAHVTGEAALLQQQNPTATAAQLENLVVAHTNALPSAGSAWLYAPFTGAPFADAAWGAPNLVNADGSNSLPLVNDSFTESVALSPPATPGGAKVAYSTSTDGFRHIYVVGTSGSPTRLTSTNDGNDITPAWSPDGKKIAFASSRGGTNVYDLYVMDADGTNVQRLTTNMAASAPSWFGSKIAFGAETPVGGGGVRFDIYTVGADGTGLANLTDGNGSAMNTDPVFSPDGTKIAYLEGAALYVMNADGTSQTAIPTGSGLLSHPAWAADGSRIVFPSSLVSSPNDLFSVPAAGGAVARLTETNASEVWPSVSGADMLPQIQSVPVQGSGDRVGLTLRAFVGGLTGSLPMTPGYQWERCDSAGNGCAAIPGATEGPYTLGPADVEHRLAVLLSATNVAGTASTQVGPSALVLAARPVNTALPTVVGTPQVGQSLSVGSNGSWTGSPTTFTYQWRRCDGPDGDSNGGNCFDIPGATSSTYAPVAGDAGFRLRVAVTGAAGAAGSGIGTSLASAAVAAAPASGGGGGGGGGGGTSVPNLGVTIQAKATTLQPGDSDEITLYVRNTGGAGSLQTHLLITLPSTVTLLGPPYFERGSGCTGTQSIDCFLDYIPNGETTKVVLEVRVSGNGTQTIIGTAAADREADPSDNTASLALQVGTPPPPSPPPAPHGKTLVGTARADRLVGTPYADVLKGLGGNDRLLGGKGADQLYGGTGNDVIDAGAGRDHVYGGSGRDTIKARDGQRDVVSCGAGRDIVYADRGDRLTGCEVVHRS